MSRHRCCCSAARLPVSAETSRAVYASRQTTSSAAMTLRAILVGGTWRCTLRVVQRRAGDCGLLQPGLPLVYPTDHDSMQKFYHGVWLRLCRCSHFAGLPEGHRVIRRSDGDKRRRRRLPDLQNQQQLLLLQYGNCNHRKHEQNDGLHAVTERDYRRYAVRQTVGPGGASAAVGPYLW